MTLADVLKANLRTQSLVTWEEWATLHIRSRVPMGQNDMVPFPDYLGAPATLPGRRESARPSFIRDWPHAEWLAVAAVCLGALTSQLDSGIITVAYPTLVKALGRPLSEVMWLGLAPFITVVTTLLLFGKRADTYGRKRIYTDGFALFILGAVGCVATTNFTFLLLSRIVQAVGVAMVQANSVALVTASVRENHRSTALGIQAAAQAAGLALGPVVGGLVLGHIPWRWLFILSTPVALVAFVASHLFLPRSRTSLPSSSLDFKGAVVLAISAGGVLGGFSYAARAGGGGSTLGIVAIGVVASIALVSVEKHAASPLFDAQIMHSVALRISLISLAATYIVFYGTLVAIPFIVRDEFHRSTTIAGLVTMAVPVGLIAIATVAGAIRRRVSSRRITQVAGTVHVIATAGVALARTTPQLVVSLAILGTAIGMMNTTSNQVIMESVTPDRRGVASGTVNLVRNVGSASGMALVATLLAGSHRVGHEAPRWLLLPVVSVAIVPWLLSWWPTNNWHSEQTPDTAR